MSSEQNQQIFEINLSELECALSFERLTLKNLQSSSNESEIKSCDVANNSNKVPFRFAFLLKLKYILFYY